MFVKDGALVLYFCYDIANSIDLDKAETALGKKAIREELTVKRITPAYIKFRPPPLRIKLSPQTLRFQNNNYKFNRDVKLYEFGVASIRYLLPLTGPLTNLLEKGTYFADNKELSKEADQTLHQLLPELTPFLHHPTKEHDQEPYTILYLTKLSKQLTGKQLIAANPNGIATFLASETNKLSDQHAANKLANPITYYPNDLVLIDWNAALVYEPTYSSEALEVLEFAVAELLELRVYDSQLDKAMEKAYDDIERESKSLFPQRFGKILDEIAEVNLEITEVIDKVENSLKLFGDLYLVNIYKTAEEKFSLNEWKSSITSKLETLKTIYEMLSNKREAFLFIVLEVMIVLLFIIDIALYIFGG